MFKNIWKLPKKNYSGNSKECEQNNEGFVLDGL